MERRLESLEVSLARIETALVVREPQIPLAAEAFEGLRRQVIATARTDSAHLAQLVQFDTALRRGASTDDLQLLVDSWLTQAGIERCFEPLTPELFDIEDGVGEPHATAPAYTLSTSDGTTRVLQPGVATRSDQGTDDGGDAVDGSPGAPADDQRST